MDIFFLGHSSFKVRGKEATLITDPYDPKMVGLKYSGISGDIITISHDHSDHNRSDLVSGVKKVISSPGEYEVMGVSIIGIPSFHDDKSGELRGKNTIYVYEMDNIRLCHLGDLGHELSESQLEQIGDCDILMIPIGSEFTIGPKEAAKIVQGIEPLFVLPMHYQMEGLNPETFAKLLGPDNFMAEVGIQSETMPKFQIKKEDIMPDQSPKVILLTKH